MGCGTTVVWDISKPHLDLTSQSRQHCLLQTEMESTASGSQPYNNFHVSKISFWKSPEGVDLSMEWYEAASEQHAFFIYRAGDANVVHAAIAVVMMREGTYTKWHDIPYVHNSNVHGSRWGSKLWLKECERAETTKSILLELFSTIPPDHQATSTNETTP
jgi:hypothetical protein